MRGLICALSLLAFPLVWAEEFSTDDNFTVILPAGWIEIPQEVLREAEAFLLEASQGKNPQKYNYGYQLSLATNWMEYPYILVQVNRSGRVPKRQLTALKKTASVFQNALEEAADVYSGLLSNIEQGEMIYDENSHISWSTISATVEEIGKIRGLLAVKFTEFGFIRIMGYAEEKDFSHYVPIYQSMVQTLRIEKKYQYKRKITDNAPTIWGINLGQTAIAAIFGGIIGGAFALVGSLRKRWKKNDA